MELNRWLQALAADLGLPADGLDRAIDDEREALHRLGRARPSRAAALLAALGEPDAVARRVRLGLALLDDHPALAALTGPLIAAAQMLGVGRLLWQDPQRPPLEEAIDRVERWLPAHDETRTRWAGAPESKRRWAVVEQHIAGALDGLTPDFRDALDGIAAHAPTLAKHLGQRWAEASSRALVWQVAARPAGDGPADLARDRQAGLDWLRARDGWVGTTDRQRWGIEHVAADIDGSWFPQALIELCLVAAGEDRDTALVALLDRLPADGPRYYTGWPHIPVDADCLGVALQLAVEAETRPWERCAGWLERLPVDGSPSIWLFGDDPAERALPWPGADCIASRLSLAHGLAAWDRARFAAVVDGILSDAAAAIDGGRVRGSVYYPDAFATRLYLALAEEHDRAYAALMGTLASTQRADGGFGTPLETAWLAAPLALRGALDGHGRRRVARFLGETQAGDGGWAAEPVYFTPGKPGLMRPLQSRALTTAYCVDTLTALLWIEEAGVG